RPPLITLDRRVPIPLYYQLKELLRRDIESGEYQPGDTLPSERTLSERYLISRPTVRQAIRELVYEGLLEREKGRGTFIARPKINYGFIQQFVTFYDDMAQKGFLLKTRVLRQEEEPASRPLAALLDVPEGEPLAVIERIRFLEDAPIVKVTNHLPLKLCPDLLTADLTDRSLYRFIGERYRLHPHRAAITLEAIVADALDAELLQVPEGAPLLLMKNTTFTTDGIPMDYFQSRFRGDRGKVKVEVFESNNLRVP
ncbi:MAG TPA: GntR family transcriptional regulator, partial [Atribacteraceae bacterium]|nr:GntR family transcriptional regulator [Atribacteraceae bacterium]